MENEEEPEITAPEKITEDEAKKMFLKDWYQRALDKYYGRMDHLENNISVLFNQVMQHMTSILRNKVKASKGHGEASSQSDLLWLLNTIGNIMSGYYVGVTPKDMALDSSLKKILTRKQKATETNEAYAKWMLKAIKTFERRGGAFLWTPSNEKELVAEVAAEKKVFNDAAKAAGSSSMTVDEESAVRCSKKNALKQHGIAMSILKRANPKRSWGAQTRPGQQVPDRDKRSEFGDEEGKTFLVKRALYGRKSSALAFCLNFAKTLEELGFYLSYADPDVCLGYIG
ncbi:unnamed protein product [Cylindrotheca closterium]|uniref:Uncharacterized protein n=1 Tax=Cylindrotheca closterium TaxID=2856 RepID=A0AAD2CUR5_9STRA|nr:unnamed protein product [Cylindrotheca closterium]